jgi:hypothetical protein
MKKLNNEEMNLYSGGAMLAACFAAGALLGIGVMNWWNPVGYAAASYGVVAGAACIAG